MRIGIGVTTHNRNDVCDNTVNKIRQFFPNNGKLVIVDDASVVPFKDATHRFDNNVGTPVAKNKCLELLDDCDHIFLFDDDTYPIADNWWKPYMESKENHLNYSFKYPHTEVDGHRIATNPNGCMMYFKRTCLEEVGGFDPEFIVYGFWHANYSLRIFNKGLNSNPFMDVVGSEKLFRCLDQTQSVDISRPDRGKFIERNRELYHQKRNSDAFIPYIEVVREKLVKAPRIWYLTPYAIDGNIGREYNEQIDLLPEQDWICIRDGDTCFTTPDSLWGKQISDIVLEHGHEWDLIGCMTNRLAAERQLYNKEFSDNGDWTYHKKIGNLLYQTKYSDVKKSNGTVAGMFMLFPKSTWELINFITYPPFRVFDTKFSDALRDNDMRIGIAEGVYLFHDYRWGKENPKNYVQHLN